MYQNRKVVVAGATGSIGNKLCKLLKESGYEVTVFSRNPENARLKVPYASRYVEFNYEKPGEWVKELDGSLGVINLSGAPVFKRWTKKYVREIIDSRVQSTKALVDCIRSAKNRPRFLVNASASGYYGYEISDDNLVTEATPPGNDFWGKLVMDWEAEAKKAEEMKVRVVMIRTSVILSRGEGALGKLEPVFRRNLGGYVKPGTQWFPWIHVVDEISLIKFAMENDFVKGPVNASTPNIPDMKQFASELGRTMKKRGNMAIPPFLIRILIGKGSSVISRGRKVYPKAALDNGFRFRFPDLGMALDDLINR